MITLTAALFSLFGLSLCDINSIYDGCGETKECQGYFISECVESRDCDMIATWMSLDETTVQFEAQAVGTGFADGQHYMAVGFSRDAEMGADTAVITSAAFQDSAALTELYWNEGHLETRLVGDNSGVNFQEVINEAGEEKEYIYARFDRLVRLEFLAPAGDPAVPTDEVNDLSEEAFHLLASCGPVNEETGLPEQHERAGASVDPIMFV